MRTIRTAQTSRLRIIAVIAVVAFIALFLSANGVASFYTDWLWFDNMGFGQVWTTVLGTRLALGAIFTFIFFIILWGNLYIADRLKPEVRPASPEEDLVERYHAVVGGHAGKLRIGIALLFGLIAGANTSSQWQTWLLFRNGGDFGGDPDPLFGRDAGFYVFELPFWTFLVDWFFAAVVLTLIVVTVAHYLNGSIRAAGTGERVSQGAKLHVSLLLAVLAVLRAGAYYVDRFHLVTSTRGTYDGALATDVNIQRPALDLLILISFTCAAMFLYNVRRRGWGLPAVALGIWLVSHFVIGGVFPLVYQRVRVQPVESQREQLFVERNIVATRFAYGLDEQRLSSVELDIESGLTAQDVENYGDVLANVPVVDPRLAEEEVRKEEAERQFYQFSPILDVDRYNIGGETRPVVLSVRGINSGAIDDGWEREHVIFTHGFGVAMASAYDSGPVVGESRALDFLVSGLGETSIDEDLSLTIDQPRIYYGENFGGYAIVNAGRDEIDYQTSQGDQEIYRYTGDSGVPIGSLINRFAFALRFREPDPLISNSVTGDSRVIYNRDIERRVELLAPFLRFDSNPYPVVVNGEIKWVIDAYTTTSDYPYAQSVRTGVNGSLSGGYNYVRNSVKAVVDAYTGDVTMYIVDDQDPLIQAWANVFPDLFTDGDEIPNDLREHLRYPEDIFVVQTDMWSSYVVGDATQFIEGALAWSVAAQPRIEAGDVEGEAAIAGAMRPQYIMARLPGSDEAEFVLQRAFVPRGGPSGTSTARPELTGIMMARSDPENYGELLMVQLPAGQVDAPDLVHSEIRKNDTLTEFVFTKEGATVEFGEMSILLIDDTIVFVRPVYVEAQSDTAVPELQRVVAVNGDRIAIGNSVDEAIAGIVVGPGSTGGTDIDDAGDGDEPDGDPPASDGVPPYDPSDRTLFELGVDIERLLDLADEAERNGNSDQAATYRAQAGAAAAALRQLVGGQAPPTTLQPEPEEPTPEEQAAPDGSGG